MEQIRRHAERAVTDRSVLDGILDAEWVGTLSSVRDGEPWVVPVFFARDGDRLIFHGSTGAGLLRHLAGGAPVAFCVAAMDSVVLGQTLTNTSGDYRSAVVRGTCRRLSGDEHAAALLRLCEVRVPGRAAEVPPLTGKELAEAISLELPIIDGSWTAKVRAVGAMEPSEITTVWSGTLPVQRRFADPEPAPWLPKGIPTAPSALALADS